MKIQPGDNLGRYRVLGPLGEGGMGVVFRARDTELGRDVAIKVLSETIASEPEARARFEQEARAVASLAHQNVLTIHDFGRAGEIAYAVTELLEGQSLRERLARGPLPWQEAVEIAAGVANGLAAAHARGIIHRDIKPANVFLTGPGQVKILDFGIARQATPRLEAEGEPSPRSTRTGIVVGTVGYMSPEQAKGMAVDHRTDIFSLGCVLYEMLTGRKPFGGETALETMLAIVNDEPASFAAVGCSAPEGLEATVRRCLAKAPERRPSSALELATLLLRTLDISEATASLPTVDQRPAPRSRTRWLALAAAALVLGSAVAAWFLSTGGSGRWVHHREVSSIAVLPFDDLSPTAQDYFADGLTDAVIAELARIKALKVISRTSVLRYKGTTLPIPEIGEQLAVDAILEGSVTHTGNRVRVIVQLIEARAEGHLLSRTIEREMADVLAIQRAVAAAVAEEVRAALTPAEASRLKTVASVRPEALEAYLKGQHELDQLNTDAATRAVELLNEAIRREPSFALAYEALANARISLARAAVRPSEQDYAAARVAATRAIELDPDLPEAHAVLGSIATENAWDWEEAEGHLKRALELGPGLAVVHQSMADLLVVQGRFDEALARTHRALELDPVGVHQRIATAVVCLMARRYQEGAEHCRRALELEPESGSALGYLSLCLEQLERYDEALEAATRANVLLGIDPTESPDLGHLLAVSGRREQALAVLERLRASKHDRYVGGVGFALVEAGLGLDEEAFASLASGYEERDTWMLFVAVDPRFVPLHGDERFRRLLDRMGLTVPSG